MSPCRGTALLTSGAYKLLVVLVLMVALSAPALADPINAVGPFNFLDVRSENTAGLAPGSRVSFGVDVTPNPRFNGDTGTAVTATQGAITQPLIYIDSPATPNQFFSSVPCPAPCGAQAPPPIGLQGAWQLTITNANSPNSPVIVSTPALGAITAPEFVTNMSIAPGPTPAQPTFQWQYPAAGTFDSVAITIFDLDDRIAAGPARLIFSQFGIPLAEQSFTVPVGPLSLNTHYSVAIQLDDRRVNGSLQARSRAFFDFTLEDDGPPEAFLPTVGEDGVYRFNIEGIVAGETIFIDPLVAIGYDYEIGAGDPNFASVLLPTGIGDDVFDLFLFDGLGNPVDTGVDLAGGVEFDFAPGGVSRFRILGIEAGAGLDPQDVTAFVTGLTFTGSGSFTGTMTPLTQQVPYPMTGALVLCGLAVLVARRFRVSDTRRAE